MLHPSYADLMKAINKDTESGEESILNSRYAIVLATSKRARQLVDGKAPKVDQDCTKPLSVAISELYQGKIQILEEEDSADSEAK